MNNNIDYAYIAGLFDGEGTVSATTQLSLSVKIRNTDKAVLGWIQLVVGEGKIYCDRRHCKPCFSLELASNQASHFLELMLPYLRIKKQQAELGIAFQKREPNPRGSGCPLTQSEKQNRLNIYHQIKS